MFQVFFTFKIITEHSPKFLRQKLFELQNVRLDQTAGKKKPVYDGSVLLLSSLVHESIDFLRSQDHKDCSSFGACLSKRYDLHNSSIYSYETLWRAIYSQNRIGRPDLHGHLHLWVGRIPYFICSKRIPRCLQAQRLVSDNFSMDPDLWLHLPGPEIDPRARDVCALQFHRWDSGGRPQYARLGPRKLC